VFWAIALIVSTVPTASGVRLVEQDKVFVFRHPAFAIEVDPHAGGRIRSWVLTPSGRDMVALWRGANEIGGLLDDRSFFTARSYQATIMNPGPETASLRLASAHPSGVHITKTLSVSAGSAALLVRYEFRNGTQAPARLWVRNFLVPGRHPQSDRHLYWVSGEAGKRGSVEGQPNAHGYYQAGPPWYAAQWDADTGDGLLVVAPGIDRFYFWRQSREFPTFEWVYPTVPAGKALHASVALAPVTQREPTPSWAQLAAPHAKTLRPPRLTDLTGWQDEATRFNVTQTERDKGFWLSIGQREGKQRLPTELPLDLPRHDDRYVALTLNVLKSRQARIQLQVSEPWRQNVQPLWETPGQDRRELLSLPVEPVELKSGTSQALWLRVSSKGKADGQHGIPLKLTVGSHAEDVVIALGIWDVTLPDERPFHVRGYCGGFPVWTGGYEVNDGGLRRLEAILGAYADMGGDVLDWNCVWARTAANTKLAETGEVLTEVAKRHPERMSLNRLPELDFAYFDPWLDLAKKYGVTRVETYMQRPTAARWQSRLLDPVMGKGRIKAGTPEAQRVITWFYQQMRRHFEARGFHGFFCKISDEISPEHVEAYTETAQVARAAGWRPFTTITGMVARTAEHIRTMNPHCDEWQLSFSLKDDFLTLLKQRMVLQERTHLLPGPWRPYRNGGAVGTWAIKAFGDAGATGLEPGAVEQFELLEDGKPLQRAGRSPWGNRQPGRVFTAGALNEWLYVSPTEGGAPKTHRYDLRLVVRRASPGGKPLVRIDATDELWFYGGSSKPYRMAYSKTWVYPVLAAYHGFCGYGQWAFYHWNKTERIIWLDEETSGVTVSPAYCGYRDGWRDARLFHAVRQRCGQDAFDQLVSESGQAALKVAPRSREVYRFRTVVNAASPLTRNAARARALRRLASLARREE